MKPDPKQGHVLVVHAQQRSSNVIKRIQTAMKSIELDIENNDGIYPFHGGRLTVSEVCRRAGVHKVTLHGSSHRDSTKPMIETWLQRLKATLVTGRKSVRKTVTSRADSWKGRFIEIANKFNEMYAIDAIGKDKQIDELIARVTQLDAENMTLRKELSKGKVVRLAKVKVKESDPIDESASPRLILVRGVPGSGKSSLAALLKDENDCDHFEADMYFQLDGEYAFDPSFLPTAHEWCLTKTREALKTGRSVVVSNVFETLESVLPYILLGYPWEICETQGLWANVHDIPQEKIDLIRKNWISKEHLLRELAKSPKSKSNRMKSTG